MDLGTGPMELSIPQSQFTRTDVPPLATDSLKDFKCRCCNRLTWRFSPRIGGGMDVDQEADMLVQGPVVDPQVMLPPLADNEMQLQ